MHRRFLEQIVYSILDKNVDSKLVLQEKKFDFDGSRIVGGEEVLRVNRVPIILQCREVVL